MPNKIDWKLPSAVLRIAAADMEATLKNPLLSFDMGEWMKISQDGNECAVCMAGAVMVGTLSVKLYEDCTPSSFLSSEEGGEISHALNALDDFRLGNIDGFYHYLRRDNTGVPFSPCPPMEAFTGLITDDEAEKLIAHARHYADLFEAEGF